MTEIEIQTTRDESITATKKVLTGRFALSKAIVPYFVGTLSLEDACRDLRLVEDLPLKERSDWTIEELFQRDLDWGRVERELVNNYLRKPDKRAFFNALTVVLLPLKDGAIGRAHDDIEVRWPDEDPFGDERYNSTADRGFQLAVSKDRDSELAYLRWSREHIFAATIDGQHRLAAMRMYEKNVGLKTAQKVTRIPVIYLILDPAVGFNIEAQFSGPDPTAVGMARSIFIDINKHAKDVPLSRQILLDDHDVESRCVRVLISDRFGATPGPALPLGVTRWIEDSHKFDDGPYINSTLALHSVVKLLTRVPYPSNPFEKKQTLRFAKTIDEVFYVKSTLADNPELAGIVKHGSFQQYVEATYDLHPEEPPPIQSLPTDWLAVVEAGFRRVYAPLILGVLTRFTPYREVRDAALESGAIDGELGFFLIETKQGQVEMKKDWGEDLLKSVHDEPMSRLREMKATRWPFRVVFQKALLLITTQVYQRSAVLDQGLKVESFLDDWLEFLEELNSRSLFSEADAPKVCEEDAWMGICRNPVSNTIKFSDAASQRIGNLLELWWEIWSGGLVPGELRDALDGTSENSISPPALRAGKLIFKSQLKAGVHTLREPNEEEVREWAMKRLLGQLELVNQAPS